MRQEASIAFHDVGNKCFELSGLRTGSVRDQILRANSLVQALARKKWIGKTQPLFVIGGGVAGIAAALTACKQGVDVVLVERHTSPFRTQQAIQTRWLDPHEFDWPHLHWSTRSVKWDAAECPLPYRRGRADRLSQEWQATLSAFFANQDILRNLRPKAGSGLSLGTLAIIYNMDARRHLAIHPSKRGIIVSMPNKDGVATRLRYGAVISCVGLSGENTHITLDEYSANGSLIDESINVVPFTPFWANDFLAHSDFGLGANMPAIVRVLISGGGDGAQQDFLRAVTGHFGRPLFQALELGKVPMDLTPILLAEDFARRSHAWSNPDLLPKRDYETWHAAYVDLADNIWEYWKQNGMLSLRTSVLRKNVHATWIIGGKTPGYCYGLNRLLILLVAKLHALATSRPEALSGSKPCLPTGYEVVLQGCRIKGVAGTNNHQSRVRIFGDGEFAHKDPVNLGLFDLIVARHGLKQRPFFDSGAPITEQLMAMRPPG